MYTNCVGILQKRATPPPPPPHRTLNARNSHDVLHTLIKTKGAECSRMRRTDRQTGGRGAGRHTGAAVEVSLHPPTPTPPPASPTGRRSVSQPSTHTGCLSCTERPVCSASLDTTTFGNQDQYGGGGDQIISGILCSGHPHPTHFLHIHFVPTDPVVGRGGGWWAEF
jgi:hypothetical protein